MSKRGRQYIGLFSAIFVYYLVHEGAHFIYALLLGVFKQVKIMGLGMQIDIYAEKVTEVQLGIFCIVGSIATLIMGYAFVLLINKIGKVSLKLFKACMYYITIGLLFIDPLYLSVLYRFFGGGDMNGIVLLIPKVLAEFIYGIVFGINVFIFWKVVLPKYKDFFRA